jgi:hypothetical protein
MTPYMHNLFITFFVRDIFRPLGLFKLHPSDHDEWNTFIGDQPFQVRT